MSDFRGSARIKPAPWRDVKRLAATDRIMIYRKYHIVPINHVNPIYINNLEQIHMVVGAPFPFAAIPTNHDLL
jgi:hypothetical protein